MNGILVDSCVESAAELCHPWLLFHVFGAENSVSTGHWMCNAASGVVH